MPIHAGASETRTFEAADGGYSFEYPADFRLDHEFADGTGEVTGVTASSTINGDVFIAFIGPWDAGGLPDVGEETQQSIVDEFTKSIAVMPKIAFQSSSMTTMLGRPALDMVFLNRTGLLQGQRSPAVNRYVVTVTDGKAYNFRCVYREDKAADFAPACDLAASTLKLRDAAAE